MRAYDPLAIRQLILNSHYRSPLDFSDAALFAAQSGYDKITEAVKAVRKKKMQAPPGQIDKNISTQLEQLKEKFEAAMNDDLNTSIALSVIFELVRLANGLIEAPATTKETLDAIDEMFTKLGGGCLGIVRQEYAAAGGQADDEIIDKLVSVLIDQRAEARRRKDFAAADAIRDKLAQAGIALEDKPEGTAWRMK
jgi:cysteinyl-tRNA synthetase